MLCPLPLLRSILRVPVPVPVHVHVHVQLKKSEAYPGLGGRMEDAWDEEAVKLLSQSPLVDRAFGLGSVLAIEMKASNRGYWPSCLGVVRSCAKM